MKLLQFILKCLMKLLSHWEIPPVDCCWRCGIRAVVIESSTRLCRTSCGLFDLPSFIWHEKGLKSLKRQEYTAKYDLTRLDCGIGSKSLG